MAHKITVGSVTDRGLNPKRAANEDRLLALPQAGIFLVADGVGGRRGGQVASQTVTDVFKNAFGDGTRGGDLLSTIKQTLAICNQSIYDSSSTIEELRGMATTVALVAAINDQRALIGHVGDSRVYRFDGNTLVLETEDHSEVNEALRKGIISPAQAAIHPRRNVINRAIGAEPEVEADYKVVALNGNTSFLVCSDGITRHLSDAELTELFRIVAHPQAVCDRLKELCYARGAEDNLSAVIVDFGEREYASLPSFDRASLPPRPATLSPALSVPPSFSSDESTPAARFEVALPAAEPVTEEYAIPERRTAERQSGATGDLSNRRFNPALDDELSALFQITPLEEASAAHRHTDAGGEFDTSVRARVTPTHNDQRGAAKPSTTAAHVAPHAVPPTPAPRPEPVPQAFKETPKTPARAPEKAQPAKAVARETEAGNAPPPQRAAQSQAAARHAVSASSHERARTAEAGHDAGGQLPHANEGRLTMIDIPEPASRMPSMMTGDRGANISQSYDAAPKLNSSVTFWPEHGDAASKGGGQQDSTVSVMPEQLHNGRGGQHNRDGFTIRDVILLIFYLGLLVAAFGAGRYYEQLIAWVSGEPVPAARTPLFGQNDPEVAAVRALFNERRFDKARDNMLQQATKHPDNANYQFWLGRSYYELKQYPEALRAFNEAARLDPQLPDLPVQLGLTYLALKDARSAEEALKRSLR